MSNYYTELNWPTLSDKDHHDLLNYAHEIADTDLARHLLPGYSHYPVPKHIVAWCKKNLPIDDRYIVVLQNFFSTNVEHFDVSKHIDLGRKENIIYLLTEAGPTTRWFNNNDEVVESVVIPSHTWTKLQVDVPHDIINGKKERIAISIFIPIRKI